MMVSVCASVSIHHPFKRSRRGVQWKDTPGFRFTGHLLRRPWPAWDAPRGRARLMGRSIKPRTKSGRSCSNLQLQVAAAPASVTSSRGGGALANCLRLPAHLCLLGACDSIPNRHQHVDPKPLQPVRQARRSDRTSTNQSWRIASSPSSPSSSSLTRTNKPPRLTHRRQEQQRRRHQRGGSAAAGPRVRLRVAAL